MWPSEKRLILALAVLCLLAYGTQAVQFGPGRVLGVDVDLSRPEAIVWPFQLSIVGDLGETGLRVPPKVGNGWNHKAGGDATYRFYVPADGKYCLWAYCRWSDICTNAVYAAVDRMNKAVVGNDPIYRKWHWVRGFAMDLKKGPHALKLSNHSDNIALQKIRFLNSRTAWPEQNAAVFSDLFYDGFDGCHIGNFASWKRIDGLWQVEKPKPELRYVENALLGRSEQTATIRYEGEDWSDYSVHVAVRLLEPGGSDATIAILFGLGTSGDSQRLEWGWPNGAGATELRLFGLGRDKKPLATATAPWSLLTWHEVEIQSKNAGIRVLLDGQEQIVSPFPQGHVRGGVGLRLAGRCAAYFDDIHVHHVVGKGQKSARSAYNG